LVVGCFPSSLPLNIVKRVLVSLYHFSTTIFQDHHLQLRRKLQNATHLALCYPGPPCSMLPTLLCATHLTPCYPPSLRNVIATVATRLAGSEMGSERVQPESSVSRSGFRVIGPISRRAS
jgi:hypothetical protein